MPNRICAALALAVSLLLTSACATTATEPPAKTSDRSRSSWCQGDREISYSQRGRAQAETEANAFDTEETVAEIRAHNSRLRAACPERQGR